MSENELGVPSKYGYDSAVSSKSVSSKYQASSKLDQNESNLSSKKFISECLEIPI